jgi:hypothetical protein
VGAPSYDLDDVIARLHRHRQRATYGAIGLLLRRPPYFLMQGRSRSHINSWVVSKATGRPTRYEPLDEHPELLTHDAVLDTPEALAAWLRAHR